MHSSEQAPVNLHRMRDVVVIGGGITGAGVFREACRRGLDTLLLEQKDFAWGTSSRSGKLVHGGLRYLRQGQVKTTWHSVREREKLMCQLRGLVEPLEFCLPTFRTDKVSPLMLQGGLFVYDLLARRRTRGRRGREDVLSLLPGIRKQDLSGAFTYRDARTDDARLVWRIIAQGRRAGGSALNYIRVQEILRDRGGTVRGVSIKDARTGAEGEVPARVVINATGVWAAGLHSPAGVPARLRPLRGSHLVFPRESLPLRQAVSFWHPADNRPVYALPWEGITLVGTTDVDHRRSLAEEPGITREEGNYLLEGVRHMFPASGLSVRDVRCTFAGVRPVVDTGQSDPSRESREHVVWADKGLVTVTGGKLTTFDLLSRSALAAAKKWLPAPGGKKKEVGEESRETVQTQSGRLFLRLYGRYGFEAETIMQQCTEKDLKAVPGTDTLWVELFRAARCEAVVHLDDLLLRRVRLGLILPRGGMGVLQGRVVNKLREALGWDREQWDREWVRYRDLWHRAYSPGLIGQ